MKIIDATISKNPIEVPGDEDVNKLQAMRDRVAKEVEELSSTIKAKEFAPEYQKVVLDSYHQLHMIERAAISLDMSKPNFMLTFAAMQGRFRERLALTDEILNGKKQETKRRNLLSQLSARISALRSALKQLGK